MADVRVRAPQLVLGIAIFGALAASVWTVLTIERPSADSITASSAAVLTTSTSQVLPGDPITFTLTNTTAADITLPAAAPYVVRNSSVAIFTPISAQTIATLKPGASHSWTWNQQDDSGHRVAEGTYSIIVTYLAGSTPVSASSIVGIHTVSAAIAQ